MTRRRGGSKRSTTTSIPIVEILPHPNYRPIYEGIATPDGGRPNALIQTEPYDRVCLYFGRIRPYKDVIDLVKTFETHTDGDTCLVVAGNPTDKIKPDLRGAIAESEHVIRDLRHIPDREVPAYFDLADIAVFPYNKVWNSGSIVLAMTFGIPYVAPDMGAISGLSPDGNVIYKDLGCGLQRALEFDGSELEQIADRNRHRAETAHSSAAVRDAATTSYGWT
jgi:glycosyltransferase involved in cell wall biosynthesis